MKKFEEQEGLHGNFCVDIVIKSMEEFWKIASEIRTELGERSYYLDEYLSTIFSCINIPDVLNTASAGENTYSAFWPVILSLSGYEINREGYPFFDEVKKYIDSHSLNYYEKRTNAEIYLAYTLFSNIKTMVNDFIEDISQDSNDYQVAEERFTQISKIVGSEKAERLEAAINDAFLVCPAAMVFIQSIITRFVGGLCARDPQTSKQIFQLILDSKNNNSE